MAYTFENLSLFATIQYYHVYFFFLQYEMRINFSLNQFESVLYIHVSLFGLLFLTET